jgi:ATP-dependent RNA helicase DeaD
VSFSFLPPPLARALGERAFSSLTEVQSAVLAEAAAGRDLLVSAQTGSGKTVAYGLAIAAQLLGDADRLPEAAAPLALIVAPTRELALQVQRELTWLYGAAGARVVSCVGGMDPRREQRDLAAGAHIVVGTPGRLCDHLRRGRLDVTALRAVVLDEADEMLDLGFRDDMEFILATTPETRRTLLFSATLPKAITALAAQYQRDAQRIAVAAREGGHGDIDYRVVRIAASDVENATVNLLRFHEAPTAIVFCNTRNAVRHLQAALLERGFSVVALSGELAQTERTLALQALRDGRARVCVATDVAARGIDLPSLDLVIHAELPNDPEVLQHRSGRTGRAGRKGVSALLVPPARRRRAELLLNLAGITAEWENAPQPEAIRALDQQRLRDDPLFTDPASEDDLVLARALLADHGPDTVAVALARLTRARWPAPEDLLDPGKGAKHDRAARTVKRDWSPLAPERAEPSPGTRAPRPPKHAPVSEGAVWFRAAIGRNRKAEARWLLPMICRRGGVDRHAIGAIRILDDFTEFEIAAEAAPDFSARLQRPDKDDNIRIEPLPRGPTRDAPPARDERPAKPKSRDFEERPRPKHKDFKPRRHDDAAAPSRRDDDRVTDRGERKGKPPFGKDKPAFGKGKPSFGKDKPAFGKGKPGGSFGKGKPEGGFGKGKPHQGKPGKAKKPKHAR